MDSPFNDGIVPDPRSDEQKAKDYHADPAGASILIWQEKPESQWKKFTPREQSSSLSCCGQSSAKGVETILGGVFSAHPPYRSRSNYMEGGMYLQDIGQVWKNVGSTTEILDKSENQTESLLNRNITVATPTKIGGYFFPHASSIDEIAAAVESYKHCMMIIHCYKSEWVAVPYISGKNPNSYDFGHCVCAVDYFMYQGKKALLIEDSTGHFNSLPPDKTGRRILTEDFVKARCVGAIYFTPQIPNPPFKFTQTMRLNSKGEQVKKLQETLNTKFSSGLLPLVPDGNFGQKTLQVVKLFQTSNKLIPDGVVGKNTIIALNLLI